MAKILRKSQASISKTKCFYWSKIDISSLLHSKCKDRIHIQVYNVKKEGVPHFSKFISVKAEKISGSSSGKV